MKKTEFEIGKDFYTETGKWRCTDIGTRIITAIQLNQEDPANYNGPPYSILEYVFDEYDMEECSFEAFEPDNIEELLKNKKLDEIHSAFMFVNGGGGYGESSAVLDTKTWKIYLRSDFCDIEPEGQLSDDDYDREIHIEIPHKNELDLGRNLVFEFVEQFIPEDEAKIGQIFRKKGAYSRYKDFLDSKGLLDKWYDFENKSELITLSQWCKENNIDIAG
jgi:hypothetical protein